MHNKVKMLVIPTVWERVGNAQKLKDMSCCDYLEPPFTARELRENSIRILNDEYIT